MVSISSPQKRPKVSFAESYVRVQPGLPCPTCGKESWCLIHRSGKFGLCQRDRTGHPYGPHGRAGHRFDFATTVDVTTFARREPGPPPEEVILAHLAAVRVVRSAHLIRLAWKLGVSVMSLERLTVGWEPTLGVYTFPMRSEQGHVVGLQYRAWSGDKWSLKGSHLGLFLPDDWRTFTKVLFVVEGASDTAALLTAGFPAIGRPSCYTGVGEVLEIVKQLDPALVCLIGDSDPVGQDGAVTLAKEIGDVATVVIPFRHKDARQFIMSGVSPRSLTCAAIGQPSEYWKVVR